MGKKGGGISKKGGGGVRGYGNGTSIPLTTPARLGNASGLCAESPW